MIVSKEKSRLIAEPVEVRRLLEKARVARVSLSNGMDHRNRLRTARILAVSRQSIHLEHQNIDPTRQHSVHLTFKLAGIEYHFKADQVRAERDGLVISVPRELRVLERRGSGRNPSLAGVDEDRSTRLRLPLGSEVPASVRDRSRAGLGVSADGPGPPAGSAVSVRTGGRWQDAWVCHTSPDPERVGWTRIGLDLSRPPTGFIPVDRRAHVLDESALRRTWRRFNLARRATTRTGRPSSISSPAPSVERFANDRGQRLAGLVDRSHSDIGGLGVVVPPAWGKTKETLLPLALTIVESFRAAGLPVTVLRFDGTQRRGESFVDAECAEPGLESLHFTYSQAAQDVLAAARFLRDSPDFGCASSAVVSFSLASIESRRAVARADSDLICAWIAVAGMVDVQCALRAVSGGIDFVEGARSGARFGVHELGGVKIDIDHAAPDVLLEGWASLEDARREMARVRVPVTWVHGRFDGWTDLKHVQALLSAGDVKQRHLIEVATGHQLRTSIEAIEVFQLIAEELALRGCDQRIRSAPPDPSLLDRKRSEELARLPVRDSDLRPFWQDYLLGRDKSVGIEILTATSAYEDFMVLQLARLEASTGSMLDLGCGTGDALLQLERGVGDQPRLVTGVDFVRSALRRVRARSSNPNFARLLVADLEGPGRSIPFQDDSFDSVLASLLVCYLRDPEWLLNEVRRVLRPGGRLVVSSPRRDADLSSLYRDVSGDLSRADLRSALGVPDEESFRDIERRFVNEAARLVELEEKGRFRFWDPTELAGLVTRSGFKVLTTDRSLGTPPQAVVVTATRS